MLWIFSIPSSVFLALHLLTFLWFITQANNILIWFILQSAKKTMHTCAAHEQIFNATEQNLNLIIELLEIACWNGRVRPIYTFLWTLTKKKHGENNCNIILILRIEEEERSQKITHIVQILWYVIYDYHIPFILRYLM